MKKLIFLMLAVIAFLSPSITHLSAASTSTVALFDDFNSVSGAVWHIPTWTSPTDGTFIGRTQFRVAQNSALPTASASNVKITLDSYNPTGSSFYGTDLVSNNAFSLGAGLDISFRAKMDSAQPGTVGGLFLYSLKPGSNTLHDEIDFELLGNKPTQVQTNIYGNEPLGAGHPAYVNYQSGSITDYHIYRILWLGNQVSWYIDGNLVRTATTNIPTGPMYIHLNMWAPAADWADAYSGSIQSVNTSAQNTRYSMSVDSVNVLSLMPPLAITSINSPVLTTGTVTITGSGFAVGDALLVDEGNLRVRTIDITPKNSTTITFVPNTVDGTGWGSIGIKAGTHTISVLGPRVAGIFTGIQRLKSNTVTLVVY